MSLIHSEDMHYLANIAFLKTEVGCFYLSMYSLFPIVLYFAVTYLLVQPLTAFDFDPWNNPLKLWIGCRKRGGKDIESERMEDQGKGNLCNIRGDNKSEHLSLIGIPETI